MFKIKMKIGSSELSYENSDVKMLHKFMSTYGMLPKKCDACGGEDIFLNHKAPSGNDYYGIRCKSCSAEINFHQKKEGGFYLKQGEKMTVYVANAQSPDSNVLPLVDNGPF